MHAPPFPVTGPFSEEVSEKTFFLVVGIFWNSLFFARYPLAFLGSGDLSCVERCFLNMPTSALQAAKRAFAKILLERRV